MIINLIFDQSSGVGFAAFQAGVEAAALMLEQAITDPITVTIEVGWGQFPTDHSSITGGAAEAEPNHALASPYSYSQVFAALTDNAAVIGDTNFNSLPDDVSILGFNGQTTKLYSDVLVWSAEAKALGFIPGNQGGIDGYVGFAKDINPNSLIGVVLHEIGHALGRAPWGLPDDSDMPDILELFRFDSASGERLVYDNGRTAPASYFSVTGSINNGGTVLANYGETSDPSDYLNDSLTTNDPYDSSTTLATPFSRSPRSTSLSSTFSASTHFRRPSLGRAA